jgi:pimeloyl-ACP methyl ester carboxylesterase
VRRLDTDGQEILAERLGGEQVEWLMRAARRIRETPRRAFGGRVVVIHGIMGARLDVVEPDGDSDRVWVDYWRIFNGRIADLELVEGELSRDPEKRVRVAGLLPEYLPLLLELDGRWKVKPFAYDWRLNIDTSAARLADTIRLWATGDPCHVVAHSMGGLVARRMIALYPKVWASMQDPEGKGRGGRLIQLGTPNRGSFAIPMVLTGRESLVRKLALLDRKHSLAKLLPILGTFPGSYQMLPSPDSGSDDRARLYRKETWGKAPAAGQFLDLAQRFHEGLANVVDPERMVYVAGYDRNTPYRILVKKPGHFEYEITRNGDGRVPHDLGLLDGVRTLWVDEAHGDLPRNGSVLAGIHHLLISGNTVELEQALPASRALAPKGWVRELPEDAAEAEVATFAGHKDGARGRARTVTERDAERIESLLVSGFVGDAVTKPAPSTQEQRGRRSAPPSVKPVEIEIEVVCGDVTQVTGDVYAVGHYVGVLPQFAEAALDKVVSPPDAPREERVLHSLTRRGVLRGELGDVDLYPWADGSGRLVAVAGMGYPGSFGRSELRKLSLNLTLALTALPTIQTVCSVLIGSGTGNLPVADAVRELLGGAADALRRERARSALRVLKLVELDFIKAREILRVLEQLAKDESLAEVLTPKLRRGVTLHPSRWISRGNSFAFSLAALATGAKARAQSPQRKAADGLLASLPGGSKAQSTSRGHLAKLASQTEGGLEGLASRLEITVRDETERSSGGRASGWSAGGRSPTRFSCVRDDHVLRAAALSDTAVVPQRTLAFDLKLFEELAEKATDPTAERAGDLGAFIGRLLIPHEFAPFLSDGAALVGELDRYTARLAWELISLSVRHDGKPVHLALEIPFARQLRTAYSPAPTTLRDGQALRALVVGDPGDPRKGHDLPGARREAKEIASFLEEHGVEVETRIGAPSAAGGAPMRGVKAAGRLEVLELLLSGRFDLVHYCGHGDFDPKHPDQAGWVFEGGLLTAREIERIERPPRLIVANACLSGRTSERVVSSAEDSQPADDAGLVPTLADEFFKRGVRDYVGTAWEVNDEGAILFARTLYQGLLADDGQSTLGDAVLAARTALDLRSSEYDALWAAYQHYGDPGTRLRRGPQR